MNKIPCMYSIVRFSPFVETGEFANVGVIMIALKERFFDFKLVLHRHARVTRFFEQLEARVYRATMRNLREELERIQVLLRQHGFDKRRRVNDVDFAKALFAEIIRPRETVVKFSEPKAVLAENAKAKLDDLFEFYVERNFVTREYQESVLERGMRRWFNQARILERFERHDLGDDEYHVSFPFVECKNDAPVKAIKPLHLGHDQPSKILDHGGQWLFRVEQLSKRNVLPEKLLFAVQGPDSDGPRGRAFGEIVGSLAEAGATVVTYGEKEKILQFAN